MNGSEVQSTLREMWETRPARPREGRQIAGVAAAIARRYDIDPVLVRVGLVVAAFYGIGAALYIAGWALLPDEPGEGPAGAGQVRSRRKPWLLVLLGIAAVAGVGGIAHDQGGILLPAAAVAALLFLLHRSRSHHGVAGPGTRRTATGPGAATPPADGTAGTGAEAAAAMPPAWDPLGAAPFAWDLPEPTPVPPAPPRPRSRVTPVTLAAALLAGGVTALVLLAGGGLTDVPVLLGVVLAVLGTGLLVGAFTRSGRGLIPVALLVAALAWGALAAPLDRMASGRPGDLRLAPVTPAALAPQYTHSAGTVELDLRGMDLAVPPGAAVTPVATRIETGAGTVEVRVPENADVRFTGSAGIGSIEFDDQENAGPGAHLTVDDLGADRVASGRPIVLDIETGAGSIEVQRG